MKILYLHNEVMGYTMATIEALVKRGAEVHIVYRDHKKLTPYQAPESPNVYMYQRSKMDTKNILHLANELSPVISVVSGWKDKGYMAVAGQLRSHGNIVVTGLDGQWRGTLRQYVAALLGLIGYFSRYYTHAWVAGAYQFEYARRLGFNKNKIIFDLYSADLGLFTNAFKRSLALKKDKYPRRFLFVGRLEPIKGLDVLINAWQSLCRNRDDWELHLIGNGSLKASLQAIAGVYVKDFLPPDLLAEEVAKSGCFILPSRAEPWGVVVHEFAAAGMPLIISDVVGAASTFLIPGLNGYSFKANDADELAEQMFKIINTCDAELREMSLESHKLSTRISPDTSAANLLSIIP